MIVEVEQIRTAYTRAKTYFARTNDISKYMGNDYRPQEYAEKFLADFGAVNGLTVLIDEWKSDLPVVNFVEFDSEQDYAWFVLRWS